MPVGNQNRPPPSYICPHCGARSYHPEDVRNRYCGYCHRYEEPHRP
jgi:ribosomal protein L37E